MWKRESQLLHTITWRNIRKLQNFVERDFVYHDAGGQRVKEPVIDKENKPTDFGWKALSIISPLIPAKAPDTKKGMK